MNSDHDETELSRLYRSAAREKSPAWLDTQILQAAARQARSRKIHLRMRQFAIAAAVATLAIAIPRWDANHSDPLSTQDLRPIERGSPLALALMDMQVTRTQASTVTQCLMRNDLCSGDSETPR
jgi:hypothetical protein